MKYQYFRIFLVENRQPSLFETVSGADERPTREQFLVSLFKRRIDFSHRKSQFVFAPIGQTELVDGVICLGRIGRQKAESINLPPEDNFETVEQNFWRASNILVDTRGGPNGQIVAIQKSSNVGVPFAILSSLTEHLNEFEPQSPWFIEINPMSDERGFWQAYKAHKGEVNYVEFEFIAPNVLNLRNITVNSIKEATKKHNAQRLKVALSNKKGALLLEGEDIEDAAEYVTKGGGTAKMKAGRSVIYDSTKQEKIVDVAEDEPLSPQKQSVWGRIASVLF